MTILLNVALGTAFGIQQGVGLWYGIYYATVTATTVGYGDISPHGVIGHLIAMLIMCTVIPLLSATFSILTADLLTAHVDQRHDELKQHVDDRHEAIRQHITEVGNGRPEEGPAGPG